ncbi:MAG TPA: hypothetical protein VHP83_02400 [Aggregatilineaceae bacterium]|nr:hypothetical protein [Aggregatilineaceae bacterium]
MNRSEPRLMTPLDLALVRRVVGQSMLPLDMVTELTRGIRGLEDALLSAVPLADLGAPTLVYRNDHAFVGQFRHRMGESVAQLTFLSPEPHDSGSIHSWMRLLEGIVQEAGKRGAHSVNAEVDENHPAFVAFRMSGFAVYSRQVILRREPGPLPKGDPTLVRPEHPHDSIAINTLYANTVPRLLQQAEPLPGPACDGLVYEREGQIAGYLAVTEGKSGVVIKPYFHPEVYDQASAIILSALTYIPRAERLPVYLYARAYQDWLRGMLEQVEFETWAHQALMVKYTLVRLERPETVALPSLEASRLRPPVVDGPITVHHKRTHRDSRWSLWRRNGR